MMLGVLYQGIIDPLERFGFTARLFVDDYSKGAVMRAVWNVQNALIQCRATIQLRLNDWTGNGGQPGAGPQPDLEGPFGNFLQGLDLSDL